MGRRGGGIAQTGREGRQDIQTHPVVAKAIMEYLRPHFIHLDGFNPLILDACAGDGVLGVALQGALYWNSILYSVDVVSKHSRVDERDTLSVVRPGAGFNIIVCNPPWKEKDALAIWNHLYSLLAPDGILVFLINNVFCYQGVDRASVLNYQKYYFLPRYTFINAGKDLLDCGIMVTHKNNDVPREAAELRPFIEIRKESIMPVHMKDIAENYDLKLSEVKVYAKCFMDQVRQRLTDETGKVLEGYIKKYVRSGQRAADCLGVSRQRFHVLINEHGKVPISFGDKTQFYLRSDIEEVKGKIQINYRK